jgi:site-specific recombinase XerD
MERVPVSDADRDSAKRRTVVNIWEDSFHAMFKRAGIIGHSHPLRHTFALDLLQRGVSLENVSSLLGHKNLRITQKYYSAFTPARRNTLENAVRQAWKTEPAGDA